MTQDLSFIGILALNICLCPFVHLSACTLMATDARIALIRDTPLPQRIAGGVLHRNIIHLGRNPADHALYVCWSDLSYVVGRPSFPHCPHHCIWRRIAEWPTSGVKSWAKKSLVAQAGRKVLIDVLVPCAEELTTSSDTVCQDRQGVSKPLSIMSPIPPPVT